MMESKKLTNRQKQAIATKERIYNSALELITTKGYDNITVDEITRKAGVAKGSFYLYFKSKDDIFFETYKILDDYFNEEVLNNLKGETSFDKLNEYMLHMAMHARDHGIDFVKQFYRSQVYTHPDYVISESRGFYRILHNIVENGQKEKTIRSDIGSRELSLHLMVIVRGILYDWALHDGNYDIVEYTRTFFGIFNESIKYRK